jgi:hypothetical protein
VLSKFICDRMDRRSLNIIVLQRWLKCCRPIPEPKRSLSNFELSRQAIHPLSTISEQFLHSRNPTVRPMPPLHTYSLSGFPPFLLKASQSNPYFSLMINLQKPLSLPKDPPIFPSKSSRLPFLQNNYLLNSEYLLLVVTAMFRSQLFESVIIKKICRRVSNVSDVEDSFCFFKSEQTDSACWTSLQIHLIYLFFRLRHLNFTVSNASSKSCLPRFFSLEWMSFTICLAIFLLAATPSPKIYSRLNHRAHQIRQTELSGDSFRGSNRKGRILYGLWTTVLHAFPVGKISLLEIGERTKGSSTLVNFSALTFFDSAPEHYIKLYSNYSLQTYPHLFISKIKTIFFLFLCVSILFSCRLKNLKSDIKTKRWLFLIL